MVMSEREKQKLRQRTMLVSGLGGYIDAGSIIAGAVALPYWTQSLGLSLSAVGWLGAISSNAASAGVGALIGGYLCDKYGRKRVVTNNLLLYMVGVLLLIFVQNIPMLFVGYILVGLSVGCDIPATWALMSEAAKKEARGSSGGLMQVFWHMGPVVVFSLGLLLQSLGLLGTRILFAHLFILALFTWYGRRQIAESASWEKSRDASGVRSLTRQYRALFSRPGLRGLFVCISIYAFWNLMASTGGFFFPYLLQTFGNLSANASIGFVMLSFFMSMVGTLVIFKPLVDRVNRRVLFGIGMGMQCVAYLILAFCELTSTVAIVFFLVNGLGGGFAAQHFFQLWSSEFFPARLRATATGFMFSIVRISCGIWAIFVPMVTATGFTTLGLILAGFIFIALAVGVIWGTDNRGRPLEEIEHEMGWHEEQEPHWTASQRLKTLR